MLPWQCPQLPQQPGLVGFDHQQEVRLLLLHQEPGVGALGVQRVGGHCDSGQVERLQQGGETGDLVGLVRHPQLGDRLSGAGHRGQQVRGRAGCGARAPGALAVHREGAGPGWIGAEQVGEPARADRVQDAAHGRRARRDADAEHRGDAGAEPGEGRLRGRPGPLSDRRERAGPGQYGGAGDQQDAHERVTPPAPMARIGQRDQPLRQMRERAVLTRGRLDQADTGRLTAHRSSGWTGRLGKVTPSTGASLRTWRVTDTPSNGRDLHKFMKFRTLKPPCLRSREPPAVRR